MRSSFQKIVGLIALVIWGSCQNKVEPQMNSVTYFDTQEYMQAEIKYLNDNQNTLQKIIYADNTVDSLFIQQPDWQKELQIFASANINKPTLYKTYSVDTIGNSIQYKSLESKNKVEFLMVTYATTNWQTVSKLTINKRQENFINRSSEYLIYQPKQSYSIHIKQNVIGKQSTAFELEAKIGVTN